MCFFLSAATMLLRVDALDARLGEGAVGDDRHLVAEEAGRLAPLRLDGQRQQADGHLLAGGDHHVLLALARAGR